MNEVTISPAYKKEGFTVSGYRKGGTSCHFLHPEGWLIYLPYNYLTKEDAERALQIQRMADRIMEELKHE